MADKPQLESSAIRENPGDPLSFENNFDLVWRVVVSEESLKSLTENVRPSMAFEKLRQQLKDFVVSHSYLPHSLPIQIEHHQREQRVGRVIPDKPIQAEEPRIRQLEKECEKLRLENQLLQSRVAEERRATARETRQYDQLLQEVSKLQAQNDKLLDCLRDRMQTIDSLTALALSKSNAHLRMMEHYDGVVKHVHGDSVTVVFEIDGDIVEHTYDRRKFVDGQGLQKGDRLTVFVHVVQCPDELEENASLESDNLDEQQDYPRKKITGPTEF